MNMVFDPTNFNSLPELIWKSLNHDPIHLSLYLAAAVIARFAHPYIYWIYLAFAVAVILGL